MAPMVLGLPSNYPACPCVKTALPKRTTYFKIVLFWKFWQLVGLSFTMVFFCWPEMQDDGLFPWGKVNLNIFYCQIYKIGLNTSFTTYVKFSPLSYKHRTDREHDGPDNKCISIYDIEKLNDNRQWMSVLLLVTKYFEPGLFESLQIIKF